MPGLVVVVALAAWAGEAWARITERPPAATVPAADDTGEARRGAEPSTDPPVVSVPLGAAATDPAVWEPELGVPTPEVERRRGLPQGPGMWIWRPERTEGGDVDALVERAVSSGLTHVYVRTGSSRRGFHGAAFLEALLPVAHERGLRVYGWDFPYFEHVADDVARAVTALQYEVRGHRIDGFVADVETESEGVALSRATAGAYARELRAAAGPRAVLAVAVPRPTRGMRASYPYAEVVPHFDAVAPMLYWFHRDPAVDATTGVEWLSRFGRPVLPIGQAYDGRPEGGPPGPPPPEEIHAFVAAARATGAPAVSFWAWEHADAGVWEAIEALTWPVRRGAGAPLRSG